MPVDELRAQLRDRGYLTHAIERWFALDPWRSRTFWVELAIVAAKAAVLIGLFGMLPEVAVLVARNHPLTAVETLLLAFAYWAAWFAAAFVVVGATGLLLRLRPEIAIDTPRALLGIAIAIATIVTVPIGVWWLHFDTPPRGGELIIGLGLMALHFAIAAIVASAALLAFSVHELQRIPAIHQRPRTIPIALAAGVLIALLVIPGRLSREVRTAAPPLQVVTTPTSAKVALIAADGLTLELFRSRPELGARFASAAAAPPIAGESASERWATVGTGVPPAVHAVRAIEGVRLRGGTHVLQVLSKGDPVLGRFLEAAGLAQRQPLPPTVRQRDYAWEIVAGRGVPSVAVDFWTSESGRFGALEAVGQEPVFAAAKGDPLRVDEIAAARLLVLTDRDKPQVAAVYLPALDVVLNRLPLDASARVASSVRALDGIGTLAAALRQRGFDLLLVGLPGDGQSGSAVVASTLSLPARASALDVAPTLLALAGFPSSAEMPGRSLAADRGSIPSYGARKAAAAETRVDREYYDSLKSLGYIR